MKFTKWDWSGPEHWGADHVHLLHWVGQVHHDQTHPEMSVIVIIMIVIIIVMCSANFPYHITGQKFSFCILPIGDDQLCQPARSCFWSIVMIREVCGKNLKSSIVCLTRTKLRDINL